MALRRRDGAVRRQHGALRRQHGALRRQDGAREADASKEVVAESRVRRGGLRGLGLRLGVGSGPVSGLGLA